MYEIQVKKDNLNQTTVVDSIEEARLKIIEAVLYLEPLNNLEITAVYYSPQEIVRMHEELTNINSRNDDDSLSADEVIECEDHTKNHKDFDRECGRRCFWP